MSGFYGMISKSDCVKDVFYGTDYHSHLGTKRAGLVFIVPENVVVVAATGDPLVFFERFQADLPQFFGKICGIFHLDIHLLLVFFQLRV